MELAGHDRLDDGQGYADASQVDLLEDYVHEKELDFDGDRFLVRDNGSLMRRPRVCRRKRPLDGVWTFGRRDKWSGYMHFASHVVHRLVARAFHGGPPSHEHVVDHIDTNRCNNRADNLRWVTRLENIILNPITLRRVVLAYGSLDNFFANPAFAERPDRDIDWMRTVSQVEAETCHKRLLKWAASGALSRGGQLGEWIYGRPRPTYRGFEPPADGVSGTRLASQRSWRTPSAFPCCPSDIGADPLADYACNLVSGAVFSRNQFGESLVEMAERGEAFISVLTVRAEQDAVKPWAVAKITLESGRFVHTNLGSFFEENGAMKAHHGLFGRTFDGPSIDDYM